MRKIMFITHQLTRTGAPIVMMEAVKLCVAAGFDVHMMSMVGGDLTEEVEKMGIPLSIRSDFMGDWQGFLTEIWDFDLVFVNTIVPVQTIHLLNLAPPKVIWWLHESDMFFDLYGKFMPDLKELKSHINIWSVSPLVHDIIEKRYGYDTRVMPFGIEDKREMIPVSGDEYDGKVRFITIGLYYKIKGVDILRAALEIMDTKVRDDCIFSFYGDIDDAEPDVIEPLNRIAKENSNIRVGGILGSDEVLKNIGGSDFVIVPSRVETMSTVAIEGMMMGIPSVISDNCGVTFYQQNGVDCLQFKSEDIKALAQRISDAYHLKKDDTESYDRMCNRARENYESAFSSEAFGERLVKAFSDILI